MRAKGRSGPGAAEEGAVLEAVENFNRLRSPEATAEILEVREGKALIRVSGPFCASCGLYDYFDDLALEISDLLGRETRPVEAIREGADSPSFLVRLDLGRSQTD